MGRGITYFSLGVQLAQGAHMCLALAGASDRWMANDLCLHLGQLAVSHKLQPLLCAGWLYTPAPDIPTALPQDRPSSQTGQFPAFPLLSPDWYPLCPTLLVFILEIFLIFICSCLHSPCPLPASHLPFEPLSHRAHHGPISPKPTGLSPSQAFPGFPLPLGLAWAPQCITQDAVFWALPPFSPMPPGNPLSLCHSSARLPLPLGGPLDHPTLSEHQGPTSEAQSSWQGLVM